jgi:hypothetical protein
MFKKKVANTEREIRIESPERTIHDEICNRIDKIERRLDFNKENESKLVKIKNKSRELLEASTSHGIPNIVRTKSIFILVMWSICTVFSACYGSYYVFNSILDFLKYDTVTKIEVISEKEVQFPAISFCALPSFNTTINKIVVRSNFDDILQNNFSDYFDEYADASRGKCFRYNTGKNLFNKSYDIQNSTIKGLKYGFNLILNIQIPADFDFVDVGLFIHNQSLPPIDIFERVFWLIPGSFNYFELDRVYYKNLDAPYSNCLRDVNSFQSNKTLMEIFHKENRAYTQENCFYKCSQLFALEESKCGCNSSLDDFSINCVINIYNEQIIDKKMGECISAYLKEFRKKFQDDKCPMLLKEFKSRINICLFVSLYIMHKNYNPT